MAFQRKAIFAIVALVSVLTALAMVSGAKAHYGDIWFQTEKGVAAGVEGKYRLDVIGGDCIQGGAIAHVMEGKFGKNGYDHFVCLVDSQVSKRTCWVTAHITGGRWFDIVLTSDSGTKHFGGCGPRDIRKR